MNFSFFLLLSYAIISNSCTTKKVNYKDMELPESVKPGYQVPEQISKEQWETDKAILLLNLKKGYAGRFNLKKEILKTAYDEIEKIEGPILTQNLCEKISTIFSNIPDNHLRVYRKGKSCRQKKKKYNLIGISLAKKRGKVWVVEKHKRKGKDILYISISGFPSHKDPVWKGFLEKIKKLHKSSDLIVFDMRNNGGGDDSTGYMLSAYLHKIEDYTKIPTPYSKQITSQTPETQTLKINAAEVGLRFEKAPNNLLKEWKDESTNILNQVLSGNTDDIKISEDDPLPKGWSFSGYRTPIYILMDNGCGSSCESSIDAFEYNPHVTKVGRNTAGTLHFGNIASVYLKNSLLLIQTPTHANFYRDSRFIEKVGITPDVEVPIGTDAYEFMLKTLF